ncbi:hypothetical protein [Sphingomonas sp.]|jgi:hypothetical protein|uniref:hypothetical protein n=1 Tax=Sphingomonas sp. TaxID=28214 RepID=UPI002ED9B454
MILLTELKRLHSACPDLALGGIIVDLDAIKASGQIPAETPDYASVLDAALGGCPEELAAWLESVLGRLRS